MTRNTFVYYMKADIGRSPPPTPDPHVRRQVASASYWSCSQVKKRGRWSLGGEMCCIR